MRTHSDGSECNLPGCTLVHFEADIPWAAKDWSYLADRGRSIEGSTPEDDAN